jgi:MoxR-like ATPase
VKPVADAATLRELRAAVRQVYVADAVADYAVRLVRATRDPGAAGARMAARTGSAGDRWVSLGASPRASMYLVRAARARALIEGRDHATPHDVKRVAPEVLRHRIVMTYEAEADGIAAEDVVDAVLGAVATP